MVPSIMASRPGREAEKQAQTITLPPPCLSDGMVCLVSFRPDVMGHVFQKVSTHPSTESYPKSLVFWQM